MPSLTLEVLPKFKRTSRRPLDRGHSLYLVLVLTLYTLPCPDYGITSTAAADVRCGSAAAIWTHHSSLLSRPPTPQIVPAGTHPRRPRAVQLDGYRHLPTRLYLPYPTTMGSPRTPIPYHPPLPTSSNGQEGLVSTSRMDTSPHGR
jgi:hypothetical protein